MYTQLELFPLSALTVPARRWVPRPLAVVDTDATDASTQVEELPFDGEQEAAA